jgi:hypothetical protein
MPRPRGRQALPRVHCTDELELLLQLAVPPMPGEDSVPAGVVFMAVAVVARKIVLHFSVWTVPHPVRSLVCASAAAPAFESAPIPR